MNHFIALILLTTSQGGELEYEIRTWKKIVLTGKFYSEGANYGDFNKDGKNDIAAGPFWYEGPDFTEKHEFYPVHVYKKDNQYSNNFFAYSHDFNKDGWLDILVYGFPGKDASWFENPKGGEGHWKRHQVFDVVDDESPDFKDINGDGVPDILCANGGRLGYVTIADGKFHAVTPKAGYRRYTHGLGIGDVNGDGRMDMLEAGGWWEQPSKLDGDPVWTKHPTRFGRAPSQMFAYDVDGDGDSDVVSAIHAHGYGLAWWEHVKTNGGSAFKEHVIMGSTPEDSRYGVKFSQLHALELVDIDGDGLKDIVTGKRHFAHGSKHDKDPLAPAVLYWFRLTRTASGVDWVPYRIDDDSGVGTQVVVGDVNGDSLPDIVVGNKRGAFVHLQGVKRVSRAEYEKAQPKPRGR